MRAGCAERPEPWQLMIKPVPGSEPRNASPAWSTRKARPDHRLTQIAIVTSPARQPHPLGLLRSSESLLSSVIQARNPKSEQLDRRGRSRLMIIGGTSRKPQLLAIDLVRSSRTDISLSPMLRWAPSGADPMSKPLK